MNKKVLVGVLIAVLVLGAAGVGFAAWKVAQKGNEQDRRAEVVSKSRAIDERLDAVWERIKKRDEAWGAASQSDSTGIGTMLQLTRTDIDGMKKLIGEIRADAKAIPSDKVSAEYVSVCDKLNQSLSDATAGVEKAGPICDAYTLVADTYDDETRGMSAINLSIDACNHKKYSTGKTEAKNAEKEFKSIKDRLVKAYKLYDSQEVKAAYAYADAAISYASMQYQLAVLGSQGSINGYNSQIKKLETQNEKMRSMLPLLDDANSALWLDAQDAYGSLDDRTTAAETTWTKVKDMIAEGAF